MSLPYAQRPWLRLCTVMLVALSGSRPCDSRPVRQPVSAAGFSSAIAGDSWTASITAPTAELFVPVSDVISQDPCHGSAPGLIKYPFTVVVQRKSGSSNSSNSPAVMALIDTAAKPQDTAATHQRQVILQPCKVQLDSRSQQQQSQQHNLNPHQQPPVEKQLLNYTAYFRPLSKRMCGKTPKAFITARIQPEGQPEQTVSTEVDLVLWGCAFMIGDALAEPATAPAGLPHQQMQPASLDSKWPPAESPTFMR